LVRVAGALGVLVVLFAAFTARLFVWPPAGHPSHADAIVVPSGDHGERVKAALDLIREGVSSVFVHAGDHDTPEADVLCAGGQAFEVICLHPEPDSTEQEARAVGRLARERGWKQVVVVTSTQHVTRAGLLFRRCVKGAVTMVGAHAHFDFSTNARLIAHEWLGVAYALVVHRGC
jgi:uncharacterized SAM-binding protein YcdF (DUF218 family)